jgi:hypothetical protein
MVPGGLARLAFEAAGVYSGNHVFVETAEYLIGALADE